MADPVDALILDLLEWIGPRPRPYAEVIDAWRTSCPRLPVWEEATDRGFVERRQQANGEALVGVTALGREFLEKRRPHRVAPSPARP
jgi:D-3-phosphoglycerate dehydrogenase